MNTIRKYTSQVGTARLIIISFFLFLFFLLFVYDLPVTMSISDVLLRFGMHSILVLSLVPGVACGIGLNFGLPLSIVCGLLGGLIPLELGFHGWPAFLMGIVCSVPLSIVVGGLYGMLLNKVKGSEMMVATYAGFSIVSLMCIAWVSLPFQAPDLVWPIGKGLRTTIDVSNRFGDLFFTIKIGEYLVIPFGLIIFVGLVCFLVWLFFQSKMGAMMKMAGENPAFAKANGIPVDRYRILGTILSTLLGAVGILVYSQCFGFFQLYQAPMMMGFAAVAAILIGGASARRASISHVLIGTFLFQGLLTLAMPVANKVAPGGNLAEIVRILVSNGIIIYALTKVKGVD